MFTDKAVIHIKSGNGGHGAVSFRREKYIAAGGPDGGDGGRGGDVVFAVDNGLSTLIDFRYKRKYTAGNGGNGAGQKMTGKNGADVVIKVPPGTILKDVKTGAVLADLREEGERFVAAKGGRGGKGNSHFATATRQVPNFAKAGEQGFEFDVSLELKLLADVGLVGFPNVGKSSFLSATTAARPEIADYPFTTLTPKLGVVKTRDGNGYVMADIPGLIEGASEGKGAGHRFLRHIERTRLILHIVDVSPYSGRDPFDDFLKINGELKLYHERLAARPQIVACNKCDVPGARERIDAFRDQYEKWLAELTEKDPAAAEFAEKGCYRLFEISALDGTGVSELSDYCGSILKDIPAGSTFEDMLDDEEPLAETEGGDELFTVEKDGDVYVICGRFIEHLLDSVNLGDYESAGYFQRVLRQKGVIAKLEEMGIEEGDTVRIADTEFDFSF
ncbi:MAG: GTPase ObgE [Clostridia bacterium]|nr:GTPase ObgE [Clostridia bacterium]